MEIETERLNELLEEALAEQQEVQKSASLRLSDAFPFLGYLNLQDRTSTPNWSLYSTAAEKREAMFSKVILASYNFALVADVVISTFYLQ